MISQKLITKIKTSNRRGYQIAHEAGLHPSTLSKIVCGIEKTKPNDPRVIAIGQALGIPAEECFRGGILK